MVNALGPHLGYTVHDPVYDFRDLTQTHRGQLLAELLRIAVASAAVYGLALARMIEQVERSQLDRVQVVLEITESLFMDDQEPVIEELERLRLAEIRVALDDFGTGPAVDRGLAPP